MKLISSRENSQFKFLRALAGEGPARAREGWALLDGIHLLMTWVQEKGMPERVVVSESGSRTPEIAAFLGRADLPEVLLFPDALFRQLSPVDTPTGVLAVVPIPERATERVLGSCVVLDGVQDPGNVGSILRSAAAAGVKHALLTRGCARVWSPKVLRAAMGAHCFMQIRENCSVRDTLAGFPGLCLATRLDVTARRVYEVDLTGPVAWFFGSEGAGLSPEMAALASTSVLIPMPGGMESLNVAAAAAVCLFEELRQKGASGALSGQ